jgi:hypothetical protein
MIMPNLLCRMTLLTALAVTAVVPAAGEAIAGDGSKTTALEDAALGVAPAAASVTSAAAPAAAPVSTDQRWQPSLR